MPIFTEGQDPLDQTASPPPGRMPTGQPEPEPFSGPSKNVIVGAAFRQNNPVVSVLDAITRSRPDMTPVADYNPVARLKGTENDDLIDQSLADVNPAQTDARIAKKQAERKDQQTLAASGGFGTVASIAAGALDPSWFIPIVGELHGAAELGIAARALRAGAEGAVKSAISESVLQQSQATRTAGDSASNIATNTLLMGLLGGGMAMLDRGSTAGAMAEIRQRSGLPPAAEAPPPGITAFHGSPHSFDAFSTAKIGSGEGAQAYGHGLYFAESEGVATSYRNNLSMAELTDPREAAGYYLSKNDGDAVAAERQMRGIADGMSTPEYAKGLLEGADLLKNGVDRSSLKTPGALYRVRINADREQMLDWDKPLSEQSPQVQEAVGKIKENIKQQIDKRIEGEKADIEYAEKMGLPDEAATARDRIESLQARATRIDEDHSGRDLYHELATSPVNPALGVARQADYASQTLHDAGIPGIRYLDAGSRKEPFELSRRGMTGVDHFEYPTREAAQAHIDKAVKDGDSPDLFEIKQVPQTRNYVVFNDKHVQITHKNGAPIQTAAAEGLDKVREDLSTHDPETAPPIVPDHETAPPVLASDLSAAESDQRTMKLSRILLPENLVLGARNIPGVGGAIGAAYDWTAATMMRFSPTLRVFSSESMVAKHAMGDLAETALRFTQSEAGITTARGGVPIDRLVKMQTYKARMENSHILRDAFVEYRALEDKTAPIIRSQIEDVRGLAGGKMSFDDFKTEVTLAATNGDEHPIPQVQAAARLIRQKVLDPVKAMAQRTMGPDGNAMLGADMEAPKGDKSFFPRSWNKEAIAANYNGAKRVFSDWLEGEQAVKAQAKEKIDRLNFQLQQASDNIERFGNKLESLDTATDRLGARIDEKARDLRTAEKRTDVLTDRASSIAEEIRGVKQFVAETRAGLSDPAMIDRLNQLEKDANDLRKADRPMSEKDLQKLEDEELNGVLTGTTRRAAEMLTGRRKTPKTPSFLSWIIKQGGIKAESQDVLDVVQSLDRKSWHGQRIVKQGGRTLDSLADKIGEEFPGVTGFGEMDANRGRPTTKQVLQYIDEAAHGKEPEWFLDAHPDKENLDAVRQAAMLDEMFNRAGVEVKSPRDVAAVLAGNHRKGVTLEDLDKIAADMQASGEVIPLSMRRAHTDEQLTATRAQVQELRDQLAKGIEARDAREGRMKLAEARGQETAIFERQARGRLGILEDRMDLADRRRGLLQDWIELARKNRDDVRGKIEKEIAAWEGKSTAEAKAALKERAEAEQAREAAKQAGTYQGKDERLASADKVVDSAVKRILQSDRELSREELENRAAEIIHRINTAPDGRLAYEAGGGGQAVPTGAQAVRGSLNARDFAIPTSLVKDFVHTDTEHVVSGFLRSTIPDIHLTDRFGDIEMTDVFRRLNEEYDRRLAGATSGRESTRLDNERKAMVRDLAATRDRLRGIYGFQLAQSQPNAARIANAARSYNLIADLGTSVFNRLTDSTNAVWRHGLINVFGDGYGPFLKSALGMGEGFSTSARQSMKDMGVGIDGTLGHMAHQWGDVIDNYLPGSKFERAMTWAADKSMIVNLHGPWTDAMKTVAGTVAAADFLRTAERVSLGTHTEQDIQRLAQAGIAPHMAERIWKAYSEGGGQEFGRGTHVANTADWTDTHARDVFTSAIGRDADMAVLTPGMEKPLWMSGPVVSLLGQYKSFVAAAHEKVLISNLQQMDGRTLQGLVAAMGMGMLSYRAYTLWSGAPTSDRPQDWIKEGISRSAIGGWYTELNNIQAKFTGGNTDVFRAIGADHPMSRRQSNSALSELLGPTYSKLEGIAGGLNDASHGTWTAQDTHKLRQALWLQNLFATRRLLDSVEDGFNDAIGVKPINRDAATWPGAAAH